MFVINGEPKEIGTFPESKEAAPEGGETAYVDTWALGPLKPGEEKTFKWNVTAVQAGPYQLNYAVAAGLDGKAKAVGAGGDAPAGLFIGHHRRRGAGHPHRRRRQDRRRGALLASPSPSRGSKPGHSSTGTRGYFG